MFSFIQKIKNYIQQKTRKIQTDQSIKTGPVEGEIQKKISIQRLQFNEKIQKQIKCNKQINLQIYQYQKRNSSFIQNNKFQRNDQKIINQEKNKFVQQNEDQETKKPLSFQNNQTQTFSQQKNQFQGSQQLQSVIIKYLPSANQQFLEQTTLNLSLMQDQLNTQQYWNYLKQIRLISHQLANEVQKQLKKLLLRELNQKIPKILLIDIDKLLQDKVNFMKKFQEKQSKLIEEILANSTCFQILNKTQEYQSQITISLKKYLQYFSDKHGFELDKIIKIFTNPLQIDQELVMQFISKIQNYSEIISYYNLRSKKNIILSSYVKQVLRIYKEKDKQFQIINWINNKKYKKEEPILNCLRKLQYLYQQITKQYYNEVQKKMGGFDVSFQFFKVCLINQKIPAVLNQIFKQKFKLDFYNEQLQKNLNLLQIQSCCQILKYKFENNQNLITQNLINQYLRTFEIQSFTTLTLQKKKRLKNFINDNIFISDYVKKIKNSFKVEHLLQQYKNSSQSTIIFIIKYRQKIKDLNDSHSLKLLQSKLNDQDKIFYGVLAIQECDINNFKNKIKFLFLEINKKLKLGSSWEQLPLVQAIEDRQDLIIQLLNFAKNNYPLIFFNRKILIEHIKQKLIAIYIDDTPLKQVKKQFKIQDNFIIMNQQEQPVEDIILTEKDNNKIFRTFKLFPVTFLFRGQVFNIPINWNFKLRIIKTLIINYLRNFGQLKELDKIKILYQKNEKMIQIRRQIDKLNQNLKLVKQFQLQRIAKIKITFGQYLRQLQLSQEKSVEQIIQYIDQQLKINQDNQQLFIFNEYSKMLLLPSMKIQNLIENQNQLKILLNIKKDFKFYGLNKIETQFFDDYLKIYLQSQNGIEIFKKFRLKEQQQEQFSKSLVEFLYITIKKKFRIKHALDQIKNIISTQNDQNIWCPLFTQDLMYIFLSAKSQKKLRLQLIKSTKKLISQPIYLPVFQKLNMLSCQYTLNQQLIWLSQPAINFVSIAYGDYPQNSQQSSERLLNSIFYCNFQISKQKHKMVQVPQICLSIYDHHFPLNITNIPIKFPEYLRNKILKIANVIMVQCFNQNSKQILRKIRNEFPNTEFIIVLQRFSKEFPNGIKAAKQINFYQNPIFGMGKYQKQPQKFISILRQKLFQVIKKCSKQKGGLRQLLNCRVIQNFDVLLHQLDKYFNQLIVFNQRVYQMKIIANASVYNQQLYKKKEAQIKKLKIHPTIKKIFKFIESHEQFNLHLMTRLKQTLTTIKQTKEFPFVILDKIKDFINKNQNSIISNQILPLQQSLNKLKITDKQTVLMGKSKNDALKQIFELSRIYNNQIKTKFFSMQLAWRELYFGSLYSQSEKQQIFETLVKLKRKQILNCQPFQCLDGDNLSIAQQLIKCVFSTIQDKIIVVTVLGPQSSGKSTLLNSLFGCDFGTSQGRCTRGVYGTLYKFKNTKIGNCDGIFLIDTEGIFSQMVEKDSEMRFGFDSKLILFCMAVSNVIIVNTRGQIDINTKTQLKKCFDKFQTLKQQGVKKPDIYLILNQNTTTNTSKYSSDIDSLDQMIQRGNIKSLGIAYQTKNYNISLLDQSTQLVIKTPKDNFRKSTNLILLQIIKNLQNSSQFNKINDIINNFIKMWTTIESFPSLFQSLTKQVFLFRNSLKRQRISLINNMYSEINKMLVAKESKSKIFNQIQQRSRSIRSNYVNQTQNQQLKGIVELQKSALSTNFKMVLNYAQAQIGRIQTNQQIQNTKRKGNDIFVQKIKVMRNQQSKGKMYSQIQISNQFEQSYNKLFFKFKNKTTEIQVVSIYFFLVEQYQLHLTQSLKSSPGLANFNFSLSQKQKTQIFFIKIKEAIINNLGEEFVIQIIKKPSSTNTMVIKKDINFQDPSLIYFFKQNQRLYKEMIDSVALESFIHNIFISIYQENKKQDRILLKLKEIYKSKSTLIKLQQIEDFIKCNPYYFQQLQIKRIRQLFTCYIYLEQVIKQLDHKQNCIQISKNRIQMQLKPFGIKINQQLKKQNIEIHLLQDKICNFLKQQQFLNCINSTDNLEFRHILSKRIKTQIRNQQDIKIDSNLLILGIYPQKYLTLNDQKAQDKQFLKTRILQDEIFIEKGSQSIINQLFYFIEEFVRSAIDRYSVLSQVIYKVFVFVNSLITIMNSELQVVNRKVTILLTGYTHSFAVIVIWKLFIQMDKISAQRPFNKLLEIKQDLKLQFFNKINQNIQGRSQQQALIFVNQFVNQLSNEIRISKLKQLQNCIKIAKAKLDRKKIQQELETRRFSLTSSEGQAFEYLMNTKKELEMTFNDLIGLQIKKIKNQCKLKDQFIQTFDFVRTSVQDLLALLQRQNLKTQNCDFQLFLQIKHTNLLSQNFIELQQQALFQYFANLMIGGQIKLITIQQVQFKVKETLSWSRQSIHSVKSLFSKMISNRSLKLTNLKYFLLFTLKYLKEQFKIMQKQSSLSIQDQKFITKQLKVQICDQKCPNCGRLCEIQGIHEKHQILYGHQFKALSGDKFNSIQAFIKCQDLDPNKHMLQYIGSTITFAQFVNCYEKKSPNGWSFSNLKIKCQSYKQKQQLFNRAWQLAGRLLCKQNGIQYIQLKNIQSKFKRS